MSLFRESYLTSYGDNQILSTGNSRISKSSLFVECRLPYSKGGYSPALVPNKDNGLYEVILSDSRSGAKKSMGFLQRKGDGTNRLFVEDCSLDLDQYDGIRINLRGSTVLYGKFRMPSGWY